MISQQFRLVAVPALFGLVILAQPGCSDGPPPPPVPKADETAPAKPATPPAKKSSRPEKYQDEDSSARLRRQNQQK